MQLMELMAQAEVQALHGPPPEGVEISSLVYDSRAAGPGALFAALPGVKADGHRFVSAAARAGAAAALVAAPQPDLAIVQLQVASPRRALAQMAHHFYGRPSEKLTLVGITGTNGKTTVSHLIEAMWGGGDVGVIGTVAVRFGGLTRPAPMTTPESVDLHALLAEMAGAGVRRVVMEVSSHALDQDRAVGCAFDLAIFTNLTRDHLDYHPDMEEYFRSKRRLFRELLPMAAEVGKRPLAVVCVDGAYGRRLAQEAMGWGPPLVTYGLFGEPDVRLLKQEGDLGGSRCHLAYPGGKLSVRLALAGRYNQENLCAAVAAGWGLGLSGEEMKAGLERVRKVPGRLERVPGPGVWPAVFVDYAHTDDALANVLEALRPLTPGRLICVFGAGGDRDSGKRPLMGQAVGALADLAVLTSDNPRSEDPAAIIAMIEPGLQESMARRRHNGSSSASYLVEPDRAAAIKLAIDAAGDGDVVLIAGKGHEDYQIVGSGRRHFDDREEAAAALASGREAANA